MIAHARLPSLEDLPPERRRTTVAALRRGDIKVSVPMQNPAPSPMWKTSHPPTDSVMGFSAADASYPQGQGDMLAAEEVFSHSSAAVEDPSISRPTHSSTLSSEKETQAMNHSAATSTQPRSSTIGSDTVATPSSTKKRRSGSIRSALRRMFSKRERHGPVRVSPPANQPRHEYHKSDTAAMTGTVLGSLKEEGFRSRDHVLHEHNQADDKYRSNAPMPTPQLPFPMNVNAPQTSPSYPNYTSFESSPHVHRRRATLPSVILTPTEAASLTKYWKADGAGSPIEAARDFARTPTPLIGVAITSGSNPNRRSKSADALRDLALKHQFPETRRRSAEIQYWRSASHGIPEVEEAKTFPQSESASVKDVTDMSSPPSVHASEVGWNGPSPETKAQAPSLSSTSDQPTGQAESSEPIDPHLSQLEFSMQQLNRSVHSAISQEQPEAFILDKPPKSLRGHAGLPATPRSHLPVRSSPRRRRSSSPSTISQEEDSHLPLRQDHSGTAPVPSLSLSKDPSDRQHQPHPQLHNLSAPLTPVLPSPKAYDNLTPVYNALRYERVVRKQLEHQVLQLQRDLLHLTTVVAQMRGVHAYPFTPSLDNGERGDGVADEMNPNGWRMPVDDPVAEDDWSGEMF